MASAIHFFVEDVAFKLVAPAAVRKWLKQVSTSHDKTIAYINYVFVSDDHLLRLNQEFLQHDTYTDIITFPQEVENVGEIAGDIYISIDRVKENAQKFGVSFENELHRVMVHGLLHLVGFGDKSVSAKKQMRACEDVALAMLES